MLFSVTITRYIQDASLFRVLCAITVFVSLLYTAPSQRKHVKRQSIPSLPPLTPDFPPTVNLTKVAIGLETERADYAIGVVRNDTFYTAPPDSADAPPGAVLKVQAGVNATLYTLPLATALSRFMYQSQNYNETSVPATAFVLWPYTPRRVGDGIATVVWAHGTSGLNAECAPSHQADLNYHYIAPFQLAIQGYAVVGIDYAGLGVEYDANGKFIPHQYFVGPAAANDAAYATQAAQTAFPELSKRWAVMGHSQGGGAAWATAARQAHTPARGYLGAIAVAPNAKIFEDTPPLSDASINLFLSQTVGTVYPEFRPTDVITPQIRSGADYLRQVGGCLVSSKVNPTWWSPYNLITPQDTTRALLQQVDWQNAAQIKPNASAISPWAKQFQTAFSNGEQPIAGPLLVIKGRADRSLSVPLTDAAVNATVARQSDAKLEYYKYVDIDHVASVTVSQQQWLRWIADRFEGKEVPRYKGPQVFNHTRPWQDYEAQEDFILVKPTYGYL